MTPQGSGPPFCPETVSNVPYVIRFLRARSDPPGFEPGSGDRMRGLALPIELQIHAPRKWGFGGSNYFLPQFKIWAGITRERIPLPAFLHRYTAYAVPRIYLRISIRRFPVMLYIIFAKPTASGLQCLAVF